MYTQKGGSSTGYKINKIDSKSFNKDIFLVPEKESINVPNTVQSNMTENERTTEKNDKQKVVLNLANLRGSQ